MSKVTMLLVNEILLPKYMNWSFNFRVLSFNEKMAPSWLKHMNSVLVELMCNMIKCLMYGPSYKENERLISAFLSYYFWRRRGISFSQNNMTKKQSENLWNGQLISNESCHEWMTMVIKNDKKKKMAVPNLQHKYGTPRKEYIPPSDTRQK